MARPPLLPTHGGYSSSYGGYGKKPKRRAGLACRLMVTTMVAAALVYAGSAIFITRGQTDVSESTQHSGGLSHRRQTQEHHSAVHEATEDLHHPTKGAPYETLPVHSVHAPHTGGVQQVVQPVVQPVTQPVIQPATHVPTTQVPVQVKGRLEQQPIMDPATHRQQQAELQQAAPNQQGHLIQNQVLTPGAIVEQQQQVAQAVKAQQGHLEQQTVHAPQGGGAPVITTTTTTNSAYKGLFALSAKDIRGVEEPLSKYAGKVVLVVNVASACGYTDSNYKGLQSTYDKYKSYGLEILAFPCNQFGAQEPHDEATISQFCTTHYHVTFPMFSKVDVNGANAHPVFKFLKQHTPVASGGGGGVTAGDDIRWNFEKFLVSKDGQPVKRWGSTWDVVQIEQEIYSLLNAAHSATA